MRNAKILHFTYCILYLKSKDNWTEPQDKFGTCKKRMKADLNGTVIRTSIYSEHEIPVLWKVSSSDRTTLQL